MYNFYYGLRGCKKHCATPGTRRRRPFRHRRRGGRLSGELQTRLRVFLTRKIQGQASWTADSDKENRKYAENTRAARAGASATALQRLNESVGAPTEGMNVRRVRSRRERPPRSSGLFRKLEKQGNYRGAGHAGKQ